MGYPYLNFDNDYGKYTIKKFYRKFFSNVDWDEFVLEYFNTVKRQFYFKMNTDNLLHNYKNIAKLKYYQKIKL